MLRKSLFLFTWLFSLGLTFMIFVLFFQTSRFDNNRIAAVAFVFMIVTSLSLFIINRLQANLKTGISNRHYIAALMLPALFLPFYFIPVEFPQSPLLRGRTDVVVQFDLAETSPTLDFSSDDIRIVIEKDAIGLQGFQKYSSGEQTARVVIPAGGSDSFRWYGAAAPTITLNIQVPPAEGTLTIFWDSARTLYVLSNNSSTEIVMKHKYETPIALNLLFFVSEYLVFAFIFVVLVPLIVKNARQIGNMFEFRKWRIVTIIVLAVLGILILYFHSSAFLSDLDQLNIDQLDRHNDVINGVAPNPWQYRVLSEWIAQGLIRFFDFLPSKQAVVFGFLSYRLLENISIFFLAFALYKRLSNSYLLSLLGTLLLFSSMKNATFDSDLSFNTYLDLVFYLIAALLIVDRKYAWIIPLVFFAALNRETSGLIPVLLLSATLTDSRMTWKQKFLPVILSLFVWVLVFAGLRIFYPTRPLHIPPDRAFGYLYLVYNFTRSITWTELFRTLGLIPFIGLPVYFMGNLRLRNFFLSLVPVWFVIHALAGVMAETRLFLVPQTVVFIPAALLMIRYMHLGLGVSSTGSPVAVDDS